MLNQDARAAARALAAACANALRGAGAADPLAAAILHGSLVLGDFARGRSDIDLVLIVERSLTDAQLRAVETTALEWCGRAGRIDLRIVTLALAARPTRTPRVELYVGCHGQDVEIETRAREPDLLVELSVARAHGESLIGQQPQSVIAPVPHAWIVEYGDRVLRRWQGLIDDQESASFMVLTACRVWRYSAQSVHCSKTEAARWALARDPSLTAVAKALQERSVGGRVAMEPHEIARVLAVARSEIARRMTRS